MFPTLSKREIIILATFNFTSANAFNFVQSKILSFGKELKDEPNHLSHKKKRFEFSKNTLTMGDSNFVVCEKFESFQLSFWLLDGVFS